MSYSTIDSLSYSDDGFDEKLIPKYINDEYFLLKLIGKGGYSFVYIAYSIKNKKYYAIKIQDPDYYDDAKAEEKIINKLNSTKSNYFIKLYKTFDLNLDDNLCLCFVFELLACSAYSLIRSGIYKNGLPFNVVKEIIKQLLISINTMHENNIIHSDIKPENILLCGSNTYLEEIVQYMEKINIDTEYRKILITNKKNKNKLSNTQIYELIAIKIYNSLNIKNNLNENNLNENKNSSSDDSEFNRKLLTSDSDSIQSYDSYDDKTNQRYKYNQEILTNLNIKLTDFGGSYFFDKKPVDRTYTIYYSPPETILKYGSTEKIDIWAIGCVMYELLTGDILFEPKRTIKCGIDRNHIYEIQRTLGMIPNYIIQKSKKKDIFFRSNNTQKSITNFIPDLLINKLKNKLINYNDDDISF